MCLSSIWTTPIFRPLKTSNHKRQGRRSPLRPSMVLVTRHNIIMLNLWCRNPNTKLLLLLPKWLMRGLIQIDDRLNNSISREEHMALVEEQTQNKGRGEPFAILCAHCSSRAQLSNNLLCLHHPARPLFLSFFILNCVRNNLELYNLFARYFYVFLICI